MTRISLIVAAAENGVIGVGGELPWHLPDDLRHFKAVTMGRPIVMGRKTWESIGRALPGRLNIVITGQTNYVATGCTVVASKSAALEAAGDADDVMVIGGGEIYALFLDAADCIHLTRVHTRLEGDAFFASPDPAEWQLVASEEHAADAAHVHAFDMQRWERRSQASSASSSRSANSKTSS